MENISVFDMLKIGIGPSSSHTLGPWRAAERWITELKNENHFQEITKITVNLYGSLALTGKGHATDIAVVMGLSGANPTQIPTSDIAEIMNAVVLNSKLHFNGEFFIPFQPAKDIIFNRKYLPYHANGITFTAISNGKTITSTYYSIGGGFVEKEEEIAVKNQNAFKSVFPFPAESPREMLGYCKSLHKSVSEIVLENEKSLKSEAQIDTDLMKIWDTLLESVYLGCHTEGTLPGGLNVRRRAYDSYQKLKGDIAYQSKEEWLKSIRKTDIKFREILKWVSCFALSVNEVNAAMGRVVTAPTNGSAGVISAVLMYYLTIENHQANFKEIKQYLLVAGEIGSFFKKKATISAAMGGCQAEIGVSSAMAAAALCELLGGNPEQVMIAAEIAMEHHLGLTCDPIKGLVQIPCIERNSMGAIKAINAAQLALETDPKNSKVSLDDVIETMWETAKAMNQNLKKPLKADWL